MRPGFIKIGFPEGHLSVTHSKLIRAAGRTHLRTGLVIASHTGPAAGAFDQIEILREEGVDPSAWIWVHAQAEGSPDALVTAAGLGAWISFDNIGWVPPDTLIPKLKILKDRGCLGRVLLSQDAGWYSVGQPGGGRYRGHDAIFTGFLPALEKAGFTTGRDPRDDEGQSRRGFRNPRTPSQDCQGIVGRKDFTRRTQRKTAETAKGME